VPCSLAALSYAPDVLPANILLCNYVEIRMWFA
jgi:hypothetical protein